MKIISNNSKLLEEIYEDLLTKDIQVDSEKLDTDSSLGKPMGDNYYTTALTVLNIAAAFATLEPYLVMRIKQFSNYIRFTKDKKEITLEEFLEMTEEEKLQTVKEYNLLIKDQ